MTDTAVRESKRLPFGIPRKKWLAWVLGILLALLAAHLTLCLITGYRLVATVSRLEKKYSSLDPASIAPVPVPDSENQAKLFRAAADVVSFTREEWNALVGFPFYRSPEISQENLERARALLERNDLAMRLVSEAAKRPASNWEIDYRGGVNLLPERRLGLDRLMDLICLGARYQIQTREPAGAVAAIENALTLSRSFAVEPGGYFPFARYLLNWRLALITRELLALDEPGGPGLARLQAAVAETEKAERRDKELLAEMMTYHQLFVDLERGARGLGPGSLETLIISNAPKRWLLLPALRIEHRFYLETMDRAIDAVRQSGGDPKAMAALWPKVGRSPWYYFVSRTQWQGTLIHRTSGGFEKARFDLARVAMALRRYRLDNGAYPEKLDALVSRYLDRVPEDALRSGPLEYRRQGEGFFLRSGGEKPFQGTPVHDERISDILHWEVPR